MIFLVNEVEDKWICVETGVTMATGVGITFSPPHPSPAPQDVFVRDNGQIWTKVPLSLPIDGLAARFHLGITMQITTRGLNLLNEWGDRNPFPSPPWLPDGYSRIFRL